MIIEYHRPETIEQALALLGRDQPSTVPLSGGSALNRPSLDKFAVVDLQGLGLDTLEQRGDRLLLGATLTLQGLLGRTGSQAGIQLPKALTRAVELEAAYNLRQVATVAGTLVAADGRSSFATAMLALDAALHLLPGGEQVSLGNLLPFRRQRLNGRLITQVSIPLNARLAYEYVARTPADLPIVCAALAVWPSGRTRLALGGYGEAPTLAFDGSEEVGLDMAAQNAYSQTGDPWASAEYRMEIAGVLAQRCLHAIRHAPSVRS